jgi:hypothetical protein
MYNRQRMQSSYRQRMQNKQIHHKAHQIPEKISHWKRKITVTQ